MSDHILQNGVPDSHEVPDRDEDDENPNGIPDWIDPSGELNELLEEIGFLNPDPIPEYWEGRHYVHSIGSGEARWVDFRDHYLAVSYNAQIAEMNGRGFMSDPDPQLRLSDSLRPDGYFAYGPNGWSGNAPIYGGDGDEDLRGRHGDDFIYGDDGNDVLFGQKGNDVLDGGRGNDEIRGQNGNDLIYGGLGNDVIYGGKGSDDIGGGFGDDTIRGMRGADFIWGDAGNDTIYGGKGDDFVMGEAGNDVIYGGSGHDELADRSGVNEMYGGKGNDVLKGEAGRYHFQTGDGKDTIYTFAGKLGSEGWISFANDPNIDSFDDLRIERLGTDVEWRVWYSEKDHIDINYWVSYEVDDALTQDMFIF